MVDIHTGAQGGPGDAGRRCRQEIAGVDIDRTLRTHVVNPSGATEQEGPRLRCAGQGPCGPGGETGFELILRGLPRARRGFERVRSGRYGRRTPGSTGSCTARPSPSTPSGRLGSVTLTVSVEPQNLDRISPEDVGAWCDQLAPSSESIRGPHLQPAAHDLRERRRRAAQPAHRLQPAPHPRSRQHQARPPRTASEPRRAEDHRRGAPRPYKLMALLAAWCAMRFGELADLRGGDMDLRTNRGEGPQASGARRREFIVGPPKSNAGVRDVAIPPHLVPLDKDHLKNLTARVGMRCCSRQRPTTTCTWLRRRSTRSTTRPGRPPVARTCAGRPPVQRRRPRRPDRGDARRVDGPARSLDPWCGDALPARCGRPGCRDRPAALGACQGAMSQATKVH